MQSSCRAGRWDRSSAFLAGLIPLMPRATTSGIMPTIKPGTRSLATGMLSSPGSRRTFLAAGPTLSPRMWLRRSEGATEHPSELKVSYNPTEMMTIAAARTLRDSDICFVGIGMPSAACNLATQPDVLPLSIGDGELCDTALTTVSVPEMFRYWLQGERFTVGFLGGAQIDRFAHLNTTVVGSYEKPKTRLPGGGGAPEISTACGEIFIIMRQAPRSFVARLDFVTSFGHGEGGDHRARLGIATRGPTKLVTDLAVFEPDPASKE